MRTSRRLLAVLTGLVAGAGLLLVAPAAAERQARPHARTAARAIVHGHVTAASQNRPTSFEVFAQRSRPRLSTHGSTEAPSTRLPAFQFGFDGLADPFSRPSDTTGALGDSFYVVAVNTQVAVYDRTGVQVVAPIQLDALHPDSSGRLSFDPKVVYDQYNDTFLVVYLVEEDSPRLSLIVAVAIPDATANNTGTWCPTSFPGDAFPASPRLWADYPGVGYNDTRVTITTNQFTFPSSTARFRYSQIMTLDKTGLYDCTQPAPMPTVFGGTKTRDTNGFQSFTLRPAETVGSSPGAQLLISFELINGKFDYLVLWRIKPTATGFTLKKACCGSTGRVSVPPLGSQGGGGVNDPDFWWDAWRFPSRQRVLRRRPQRVVRRAHGVQELQAGRPDGVVSGGGGAVVRGQPEEQPRELRSRPQGRDRLDRGRRRMADRGDRLQRDAVRDVQPGERSARRVPLGMGRHDPIELDGRYAASPPGGIGDVRRQQRARTLGRLHRHQPRPAGRSVPRDLEPVRGVVRPMAAVHQHRSPTTRVEPDRYPEPP